MTDRIANLKRRLGVPPSRLSWLYVGSLSLVVGTLVVGAKIHKVLRLSQSFEGDVTAGAWATVIASDLLFVAAWTALWLWAIHLASGGWKRLTAVAMHLSSALLLLFLVSEHGSFLVTGALLDWNLLAYSIKHFAKIRKVIASEMGLMTWLALVSAVLIALAPAAVIWLRKTPAAIDRAWSRVAIAAILSIAIAVTGLRITTLETELPTALQPIRNNTVVEHLADAIAAVVVGDDQADLAAKPVQPLVVAQTARTKRHNVVLMVLESVRAQSTTPYNAKLQTTPFLDKLAKRGVVVENAFTVVPHTTKSLVPIHCGLYPKIVPDFDEATPGALPSDCLARILRRTGYATHYMQNPESVFERRRDLVDAFGFQSMRAMEDLPSEGFEYVGYFGYEDDIMLKPAMSWVQAQKGPFYLAFLNAVSHHPYEVPKNFPQKDWGAGNKLNKYYDSIAYTDRFVERVFKGFEERGLLDDTVFVLIGDHGEGFGEHGRFQHDQTIYDEGLRVPMMVIGPGVPKGKRIKGLWQNIDLLPTVLDVLDLEVVAGELPGRSVLSGKPHERLFHSCWRKERCQAMRVGDLKYIHHYGKRDPEVYNFVEDPWEKTDLFAAKKITKEDMASRVAEMKAWAKAVNTRYKAQEQRRKNPWISTTPPAKIQHPADIQFDDFTRFLGYDVERERLAHGEATWFTYYFEVLKDPEPGWQLFVHAVGPTYQGKKKMIHGDHVPVEGSYPIDEWKKGQFITDRHWLRIKPGYPSGDYWVLLGMYNPKKNNSRASPKGTGVTITHTRSVHLTTLDVVNEKIPRWPIKTARDKLTDQQRTLLSPTPPAVEIPRAVTVQFGDIVQLIGVDTRRSEVVAGQKVTWTFYYHVLQNAPRWTGIFTHIIGPVPKTSHYHNAVHTPALGGLPVHEWRAGDYISDPHTFEIPKHFPPGKYKVWLGFWDPNMQTPRNRYIPTSDSLKPDAEGRVLIGELSVTRPKPKLQRSR